MGCVLSAPHCRAVEVGTAELGWGLLGRPGHWVDAAREAAVGGRAGRQVRGQLLGGQRCPSFHRDTEVQSLVSTLRREWRAEGVRGHLASVLSVTETAGE